MAFVGLYPQWFFLITIFYVINVALTVPGPSNCAELTFWGNCAKNDLCICASLYWFNTTYTAFQDLLLPFNSFSDICQCTGDQPGQCQNEFVHNLVFMDLSTNAKVNLQDEATCLQLVTLENSATLATRQESTSTETISSTPLQSTEVDNPTTTTITTMTTWEQGTTTEIKPPTQNSGNVSTGGQPMTTSDDAYSSEQTTILNPTTTLTKQETSSTEIMSSTPLQMTGSTYEYNTTLPMTTTGVQRATKTEITPSTQHFGNVSMCPCECEYFDKIEYWSIEANQLKQYNELSQRLAELKRLLNVETKNLSSFINTKISAADERPSASAAGYFGAAIMALVFGLIVLLDLPVILQQIREFFINIREWITTC